MNKVVYIFLTLSMVLLQACSWVDDDYSDCPTGTWIELSYTYNLLNVEANTTQVKEATLFILNQEGNCVAQEFVDSTQLADHHYQVRIPSTLPEGDYNILVWSGLQDTNYVYSPEALTLKRDSAGINAEKLSPLFHGRLDGVHVSEEYVVHKLSLMKDTNVFSCMLQSESDTTLNASDFHLELYSQNATMDHWNNPIDTATTHYLPFMQQADDLDDLQVVLSGLNTLRMMEKDSTRLRLVYVPTNKKMFDIPLTKYVLLSRKVDFGHIPAQEYLDRQDRYDLIFFLTPTDNPYQPFVCLQLQVNGWIIRLNDAELEDR